MHHIILYLCMIIKCKDPHLYISCSEYVEFKSKMDARKKSVGSLCKCTFITAGMLLYHCSPWSLLLSLPNMSLFNINIHYVDSSIDTGYYSTQCYLVTRSLRHFEGCKLCQQAQQFIASQDGYIQFTETLTKAVYKLSGNIS